MHNVFSYNNYKGITYSGTANNNLLVSFTTLNDLGIKGNYFLIKSIQIFYYGNDNNILKEFISDSLTLNDFSGLNPRFNQISNNTSLDVTGLERASNQSLIINLKINGVRLKLPTDVNGMPLKTKFDNLNILFPEKINIIELKLQADILYDFRSANLVQNPRVKVFIDGYSIPSIEQFKI